MSKTCTPLWREVHFEVKMWKALHARTTFGHLRGRRKGLCTWSEVSKTWRFCSISKNDGRCGAFDNLKRMWKDAFRVAGPVQETCSSEMSGGPGAVSLREVAFWSIRSSVLGRWFCVTGAALRMTWHHYISWQAQYFRQVEWKNRKPHWYEADSSALNFPFLKEVSQNCFVFDVVNF